MRTPLLVTLSAVSLLAGCATSRPPAPIPAVVAPTGPDRRAVVKDVMEHNVRVLVRDGENIARTQSGVVLGRELKASGAMSYVLTCAHGLATKGLQDPKLTVVVEQGGGGVEVNAEVVAYGGGGNQSANLALLRVAGVDLPPAQLAADRGVQPGDEVLLASSPYGMAASVSGGLVSRVMRDGAGLPKIVQTDALASHGAAGGGLYDVSTGHLLGLIDGYRTVRFKVSEREQPVELPLPGETFAIPAAAVRGFLKAHGLERLVPGASAQVGAEAATLGSTSIQ